MGWLHDYWHEKWNDNQFIKPSRSVPESSDSMIRSTLAITVLPAYNAAKAMERPIAEITPRIVNDFLMVVAL
jgi:hypothetical protein